LAPLRLVADHSAPSSRLKPFLQAPDAGFAGA